MELHAQAISLHIPEVWSSQVNITESSKLSLLRANDIWDLGI